MPHFCPPPWIVESQYDLILVEVDGKYQFVVDRSTVGGRRENTRKKPEILQQGLSKLQYVYGMEYLAAFWQWL